MPDPGDFASWCSAAVQVRDEVSIQDDPGFEVARQCARIWRDLVAAGRPSRRALDPTRLGPALLPWVTLIDVLDEGGDYLWRLSGEEAVNTMGQRLAGRRLSRIEAEMRAGEAIAFRSTLDRVVESQEPVFYEMRNLTLSRRQRQTCGGLFPLWTDDAPQPHPDCIFSGFETRRTRED